MQPYGYQPMPQPAWEPPQRPPRPRVVEIACTLLVIVVCCGIIGTIVSLSSQDEVRREVERHDAALSTAQVDLAVHIGVISAVVVGFGVGAFYLFLAYKMLRGRNWARITTWVFMGLASLGVFTAFALAEPALSRVLTVFDALCAIAIIILLAQRPSNAYFRKPVVPPYGYYPAPPR
jgi:multisubunit Na+/H+ antiporter MnhC subunit